jgi:hypothetical protein
MEGWEIGWDSGTCTKTEKDQMLQGDKSKQTGKSNFENWKQWGSDSMPLKADFRNFIQLFFFFFFWFCERVWLWRERERERKKKRKEWRRCVRDSVERPAAFIGTLGTWNGARVHVVDIFPSFLGYRALDKWKWTPLHLSSPFLQLRRTRDVRKS